MRQEADLVPYDTTRLTGSPLLALAPHPDDEVFGCAAVTLEATRRGADLHIVVVTDGSAQGEVEARRQESRAAADVLGTNEPEFWGFDDRGLEAVMPELVDRITAEIQSCRPQLVLTPSPAELHPDHRAVGLATYRVLRNLPGITGAAGFRLAAYEVSAFLRPNTLVDLSHDWPTIRKAARKFASQNVVRPYLEVLEALATARRLTLPESVTHAAGFFVVDGPFIKAQGTRAWAEHIGPTAGLELDDPAAGAPPASRSWLNRLLGRNAGD